MPRHKKADSSVEQSAPVASLPEPTVKDTNLFCPAFGVTDGYGNSAEQMSLALERIGITVHLIGIVGQPGVNPAVPWLACYSNAPEIYKRYQSIEYDRSQFKQCDTTIFYCLPTGWSRAPIKRKVVGFSMFECDTLPPTWIQFLDRVDEIWVPSTWNQEVFSKYAKRDVHVIPLGVNAQAFPFVERQRTPNLRFLHWTTHSGEYRKGADIAIAAFKKAFPGREDVYLEVRGSLSRYNGVTDDHRIQCRAGAMPTAKLAELYHSFDCLVNTSRGEGLGLVPLEAMTTGMPVIHSGVTGMADYRELGLTVASHREQAQIGLGRESAICELYRGGYWHTPDVDEVAERMLEVDQNYSRVMTQAARDSRRVASEWTWERTARHIQARLEEWPSPDVDPQALAAA